MKTRFLLLFQILAVLCYGQANGKLQIHFMDVDQGDGALLISPGGETVLFDAGKDLKFRDCTKPLSYLDQLGIKQIDYVVVSHYHFDHIGCIPDVLRQARLQHDALDRGDHYPGATYDTYVADCRAAPPPPELALPSTAKIPAPMTAPTPERDQVDDCQRVLETVFLVTSNGNQHIKRLRAEECHAESFT